MPNQETHGQLFVGFRAFYKTHEQLFVGFRAFYKTHEQLFVGFRAFYNRCQKSFRFQGEKAFIAGKHYWQLL